MMRLISAVLATRVVQARAIALLPVLALLLASCQRYGPPPAGMTFEGLPVSGSLALARQLDFDRCIAFPATMRCRQQGVMIGGEGPYNAAVDLRGGRGQGGFDHLILWHDTDQMAVYEVAELLERQGWRSCYKPLPPPKQSWGDQQILTHSNARVRVSMDLSYYAKRRLRIIPEWNPRKPVC